MHSAQRLESCLRCIPLIRTQNLFSLHIAQSKDILSTSVDDPHFDLPFQTQFTHTYLETFGREEENYSLFLAFLPRFIFATHSIEVMRRYIADIEELIAWATTAAGLCASPRITEGILENDRAVASSAMQETTRESISNNLGRLQ
mmetsp:Transcript_9732/g.27980  ORF Transcript_9732/g.27980 Transcript_9732/m.27980 type:complete len:145 (-) Transcript_9732:138-572(-)